jgi:hypothetical protein
MFTLTWRPTGKSSTRKNHFFTQEEHLKECVRVSTGLTSIKGVVLVNAVMGIIKAGNLCSLMV